jgi:hypothetical protein
MHMLYPRCQAKGNKARACAYVGDGHAGVEICFAESGFAHCLGEVPRAEVIPLRGNLVKIRSGRIGCVHFLLRIYIVKIR